MIGLHDLHGLPSTLRSMVDCDRVLGLGTRWVVPCVRPHAPMLGLPMRWATNHCRRWSKIKINSNYIDRESQDRLHRDLG